MWTAPSRHQQGTPVFRKRVCDPVSNGTSEGFADTVLGLAQLPEDFAGGRSMLYGLPLAPPSVDPLHRGPRTFPVSGFGGRGFWASPVPVVSFRYPSLAH